MTSTRDQIARGTRLLLTALACASLGFEGNFAGCGGPTAPPSGPIPEGPSVACLSDADCTAPMCQQALCIANRCVMRDAPVIDRDGDGFGPLPCGNDCDDLTASRFPGGGEACDRIDNDCDDRVDESTSPAFIVSQLATEALASAPLPVGSAPGLLFLSSSRSRALEARWLGTESSLLGLASISDGPVGLAAARPLGDGRAEIVWSTMTTPSVLRRVTLRVSASASITLEATETLMELPTAPTLLQMEGDARGRAILVATDATFLLLPGLAPITVPNATRFDMAIAGDIVALPGMTHGLVDCYDRGTGTLRGSFMAPDALSSSDSLVAWGARLFVSHQFALTEIDTTTLTARATTPLSELVFLGSTTNELVFVTSSQRVAGLDEDLISHEHAFLPIIGTRNQIFELDTRVVVVSTSPSNTTYQVEQCGN